MTQDAAIATLTQRHPGNLQQSVQGVLVLSAEERRRSRYFCQTDLGDAVLLNLSRGMVLANGDLLSNEALDWWVRVQAKAEPVLRVEAPTPLGLLRAAYHLGNRHVPLELTPQDLKLAPDPVLQDMLEHLGMTVTEVLDTFHPEVGAYSHHHG
jgi:urease accessory protein